MSRSHIKFSNKLPKHYKQFVGSCNTVEKCEPQCTSRVINNFFPTEVAFKFNNSFTKISLNRGVHQALLSYSTKIMPRITGIYYLIHKSVQLNWWAAEFLIPSPFLRITCFDFQIFSKECVKSSSEYMLDRRVCWMNFQRQSFCIC